MNVSQMLPLEKTESAVLTGFVRVLDTAPSFVVPLFRRCNHGEIYKTSALFAQVATSDHTISGFLAFDLAGGKLIPSSKPLEVRVGAPSLVAYELGDNEIVVGTFEELRARLGDYVERPIFDNKPFSQWELCEFCDRIDFFPAIARRVKSTAIHSNTTNYFLANCLARSWIRTCLRKDYLGPERGRAIDDRDYRLVVRNGDIAFSVSDAADSLVSEIVAFYVNSFNELMARCDPEPEVIHKEWQRIGGLRAESSEAAYRDRLRALWSGENPAVGGGKGTAETTVNEIGAPRDPRFTFENFVVGKPNGGAMRPYWAPSGYLTPLLNRARENIWFHWYWACQGTHYRATDRRTNTSREHGSADSMKELKEQLTLLSKRIESFRSAEPSTNVGSLQGQGLFFVFRAMPTAISGS